MSLKSIMKTICYDIFAVCGVMISDTVISRLCVAAHDLMEVGTGKAGVLCGMGDVALVNGQFGRDIPPIECFEDLFLRLGIGGNGGSPSSGSSL